MREATHHIGVLLSLTLLTLHGSLMAGTITPSTLHPPLLYSANSSETQNLQDSTPPTLAEQVATAIQRGNFAEAYHLWRPRADDGDANAQYGIGWMYHNGYGLAINDEEAIRWWELAAAQGHVDATFALGMLYALGEGRIQRDMPRAVGYYHKAASHGHEDARLLLRTLIIQGDSDARRLMLELLDEARQHEIGTPATVRRPRANVRRGPGNEHPKMTVLLRGHQLLPLQRQGEWLLIGIAGRPSTGWIHDSLVTTDFQPRR